MITRFYFPFGRDFHFPQVLTSQAAAKYGLFATNLALPFLSLDQRLSRPLTYGMGVLSIVQTVATPYDKPEGRVERGAAIAKTVSELAATYFQHRVWMAANTVVDIVQQLHRLYTAPQDRKLENLGKLVSTTLHLATQLNQNSLQAILLSVAFQGVISFCEAYAAAQKNQDDIRFGRELTAMSKLAMSMIRFYQGARIYAHIQQTSKLWHEIMVAAAIPPTEIQGMSVPTEEMRQQVYEIFRQKQLVTTLPNGVETVNNIPLADFISIDERIPKNIVDRCSAV